ncbi:sugar phosphate isomerase/epimerase family protein [Chryseosolibacter indicus]|uniref:Sugar phosphate isomerase/epimerase n=1 Tax=Chryseosolibacter indicus TaxID=2782351 RepID=A0ABS5VPE8_9BACT|nr:sugar phosphate isomerase/epimerase family protein [Chryseosolibacter indicus]MBT1701881.1 sugar phosphate isomerase/epimerase [Chryseosolibacter indicus]
MQTSRREFVKCLASTVAALSALSQTFAESKRVKLVQVEGSPISVFSRHLHWLDYSEVAKTAKLIGFDGVDLTVRPKGHVLPENVKTELPKATEAIRREGLEIYEITTAISDANEEAEAILGVMRNLGIRFYRLNWFKYDENLSMQENLKSIKAKVHRIAALNKKYKVHGAYQNHAGAGFGASVWDLFEVLKDFDPDYIGCQFDVCHATVEGVNSWVNDFKIIHPYIKTYNLKDFQWVKKNGKWIDEDVPLGQGNVDFVKFFELVSKYNVKGPVSMHYEYPLGGAESGATAITISKEEVIEAMGNDLGKARKWIS